MGNQFLVELYTNKRDLVKNYLDLTHQKNMVLKDEKLARAERIKKVEELINSRAEYINKVDELDKEISGSEVNEVQSKNSSIQEIKNEIVSMLKEVQEIDREDNSRLNEFKFYLKKQMKSLQAGKLSFNTYAKRSRQVQGFFVDNKK
ncbi:MAG: hypothetical protein K9L17_03410 [Clostridiales bacterium]|nr:hypothetical protein [Clostridiales bacterium]MCF8021727.1 hypothetical protein [Clostridiales bacterium]